MAILKPVVVNGVEGTEIGFHLARASWVGSSATKRASSLLTYGFGSFSIFHIISLARSESDSSRKTGTGKFNG